MTLLEQQSISGEDLISQLIQKEAERDDSYTMDHPAWDILNQECKEIILGIVLRSDADKLIEQYRESNPYRNISQSGNFYGVSSYDKEAEGKVTQYWDVMGIPVKIMYVLSGGDKMYHFNAYSLRPDVEKARCSDENYAKAYYEKTRENGGSFRS